MSNSTPTYDAISGSQLSKEVTANAYFDAASPATLFGRRQSTSSGLTWGYYGGTMLVDGVLTQIANGTLALSASSSATNNYIEITRAGVISKNNTGFTPGSIPLYLVVASNVSNTVTSYTDYRAWVQPSGVAQRLAKTLPSDANYTLTQAEAVCGILEIAGSISVQRNIVVPLAAQQWTVRNATAGGFALQFIGASGTGVVVANGKRAILYADGTNVVRVTADA